MTIRFTQREVLVLYLTVTAIDLLLIGATLTYSSLDSPDFVASQLDLRREANLGAWYSSAILLIAGLASVLNALSEGGSNRGKKWVLRVGWLSVAALFIAISGDEVAQMHEQLAGLHNQRAIRTGGEILKLGAGDWLPLLLPAIIASAVFLLAFFVFVFLKHRLSLLASLAGLGCWVGAIYFESVESHDVPAFGSLATTTAIEESLEIVGTTLLIVAIVEFLRRRESVPVA